ncbi:MAG: HNH endonuclease [Myxococcota bacterium]
MHTLVLSPEWEPVRQIDWKRAVKLALSGMVEVVAEYEDRLIRSVSMTMRQPLILRLVRGGGRRPRRGVPYSKDNVFVRDKGSCQYCGTSLKRREATIDHVFPRSRGGRTQWTNVVVACLACNQLKGDRTPEEAGLQLARTPERPRHLPGTLRLSFRRADVPEPWRPFLVSVVYADDDVSP